MGRIVIIVIFFFLLLTVSAATGFPRSLYADDLPRGLRALDWIVTNLATEHFGRAGGAALFAVVGLLVTVLAVRQAFPRSVRGEREPRPDPSEHDVAAPAPGRRPLVASGTNETRSPGAGTTKGGIEVLLGAEPGSSAAQGQSPAESEDCARLLMRIAEDNAPPPPPEGPLPAEILAAGRHPIVFRQIFPPPADPGLSFYGGRPIAPADFAWPRTADAKPLHFIMQWDCRELVSEDRAGLLPTHGVLYFFLDFEWGREDGFRFIHLPGPATGWEPLDPPEDLGPVHGGQGAWQMAGCTPKVDDPHDYVPRLMPHFPFTPVSFDYPVPAPGEDDDGKGETRLFWNDGTACREALLAVEKAGGASAGMRDLNAPPRPFDRPFGAFPHDFGAIRVLAAQAIKELDRGYLEKRPGVLPDLSAEEKREVFTDWLEQARELYRVACGRGMGERVPRELSDHVWEWTSELEPVFRPGFERIAVPPSTSAWASAARRWPASRRTGSPKQRGSTRSPASTYAMNTPTGRSPTRRGGTRRRRPAGN